MILRMWMIPAGFAVAISLLSACAGIPSGPRTILSVEGFKSFPSARAFDLPGTIYRIDPSGDIYQVDAIADVEPKIGDEVVPELTSTSTFTIAALLKTVGATLPTNASASLSRTSNVTTKCVAGFRRYLTDYQVDSKLPAVLARNTIRGNNKYYLIRETVASKSLTFSAKKSWVADAGIEPEFRAAMEANARLNWGMTDEFSMDKTFNEPMQIWYKAERLIITIPDGAAPGQFNVKTVPATTEEFTISGNEPKQP